MFVQGISLTTPDVPLPQSKVVEEARKRLRGKVPFVEQALELFRNAGVEDRYLCRELDEIFEHPDLAWRNATYITYCEQMAEKLFDQLMSQTGLAPEDVDVLITTSCTGFMIPAVDAHLINTFHLRRDVVRMPFTELGCAAGAMAVSRAMDYLTAYPNANVVVMAIELPSLTYQKDDYRVANLVSAALFGDGGAAALLSGKPGCCRLKKRATHFFYDTEHLMGFDLNAQGFKIILDKGIPDLIRSGFHEVVSQFLASADLDIPAIRHWVFHPGGRKIMDTLGEVLGIDDSALSHSRHVLRRVGNLSSASILWVLNDVLAGSPESGPAVLGAFGPGFNAELILAEITT